MTGVVAAAPSGFVPDEVRPSKKPCVAVYAMTEVEGALAGAPPDAVVRCYRARHGDHDHEGSIVTAGPNGDTIMLVRRVWSGT